MNIQAKQEGIYVAEADYYPKILAAFLGFHFDRPLGRVLTPGILAPETIAVNVFDQDFGATTVTALQPITALLKVRQGVRVATADAQIAQSQATQADRAICSGVEQLYYGLLAADRILASGKAATSEAERKGSAQAKTLEARIAMVEAKQAIQTVTSQRAALQEQLNALLDLPLCTELELTDLPPLVPTITCADDAIGRALACNPEIFQAEQDIVKADAAIRAAKVDYLPDVNVFGGVVNQDGLNIMQHDVGYMALSVNYTLFAGGKRVHSVRQAETVLAMARQKALKTRDDVRLKAYTAYREFEEAQQSAKIAEEMLKVRRRP